MNPSFWQGKKVLITGNTGFKGGWLSLWLHLWQAEVFGYALSPSDEQALFYLGGIDRLTHTCLGDIADLRLLSGFIHDIQPEIIIHMAAQPLVRKSYQQPKLTYETNVIGTVHLLEAVRNCPSVKVVVNITTDKCYENREWVWGYRENDALGGFDPYSSSKACAELVTAAYRNSFFAPEKYPHHGVAVATARAGNVIGGGDWAEERLLPDMMRALLAQKKVVIRNPEAIRPWQHVLEPLSGYILLAEKLWTDGPRYGESWNFGPENSDMRSVRWIVEYVCNLWERSAGYIIDGAEQPHETNCLMLSCSKAHSRLGWYPRWNLERALVKTVEWLKAFCKGDDLQKVCLKQIEEYLHN